jgi:hypothetical protein
LAINVKLMLKHMVHVQSIWNIRKLIIPYISLTFCITILDFKIVK